MQDRYAGDIGDYVKLALLRAIAPGHQLGVLWYLYPDETHNGDGRHTTYLDSPGRWRHLDPALFDALQQVMPERTVASLESCGALGEARFFGENVDSGQIAPGERDEWREKWFARAIYFLADCSVIFADPDNGLVCDNPRRRRQKKFGKQIPVGEARAIAKDRTAVIYHHNTRYPGGHDLEVRHWREQLGGDTIAVRANAFSCRTFFIVNPTPDIRSRAESFCDRWADHRVFLNA